MFTFRDKLKEFLEEHNCGSLISFIRYLKYQYAQLKQSIKILKLKCKKLVFSLRSKRIVDNYLKNHKVRKLQLGAGGNILQGWLNTDLLPYDNQIVILDVTKPFFFLNDTFDYIFCEHMIEHLPYSKATFMLKECLRILKPGGRIRISTPNLKVYLDLFKENKDEMQRRYITWIANNWLERGGISLKNEAFIINLIMRGWGHNFVYDFETLKDTLLGSGFRNVLKCTVGESQEECFRDIERHGDTIKDIKGIKKQHGRLIDNEMVRFDTLVVEAIK